MYPVIYIWKEDFYIFEDVYFIVMGKILLSLISKCQGSEVDSLSPVISVITHPEGILHISPFESESYSFELVCVEGNASLQVGECYYRLDDGQDIVVTGGNGLSMFEFSKDFRGYLLVMKKEYCESIPTYDYYAVKRYYTIPVISDIKRFDDKRYVLFFELLKRIIRSHPVDAEEKVRCYLRIIFSCFADHDVLRGSYSSNRNSQITKQFFDSLETSSMSLLNDSYLAKQLGVSKRSMIYAVRSITGVSPSEHVRRFKVYKAKEMISQMDTSASMVDVSDALGFSSVSSFSRFFKSQTGSSPSIYRDGDNK